MPDPIPAAGLSRRRFLALTGAAAGSTLVRVAAAGGVAAAGVGLIAGRDAQGLPAFVQPLRPLEVLTDSDITLVAAQTHVQLLPGAPTRMWTFNGSFPGPLIRRPSGQSTRVTVLNRLPEDAGTLSIHHHGGHSRSSEDGLPGFDPIPVGAQRTYTYELVEDGAPERGALQWYHDHTHLRTSKNTWMGLAGLFLLEDGEDAALGLPTGERDIPLLLAERSFDAGNQLTEPYFLYDEHLAPGAGAGHAPDDDVIGNRVVVNGVLEPYLDVRPAVYRFRVLNASHFRPYELRLTTGQEMTLVGTESGLLPEPVMLDRVLVGPAERVELLVDLTGLAGQRLRLVSRNQGPGAGLLPATAAPNLDLLELRVAAAAPVVVAPTPAALRPLPTWAAEVSSTPDRMWVFGLGVDPQGRTAWTVNGRAFDHERVDARPELDAVETWAFVNASPGGKSHYVHIHDVDWLVVQRNGGSPEAVEGGLKETFRLDPGEVLLVASKFTDHLGPYMIHCHMMEHEDHGMMATWEVVPPGSGDALPPGASLLDVLVRDVPDARVRAQTLGVLAAAVGGRPAPRRLLEQLEFDVLGGAAAGGGAAAHIHQ